MVEAVDLLTQWYRIEGFASAYDWLMAGFERSPESLPLLGGRRRGGGDVPNVGEVVAARLAAVGRSLRRPPAAGCERLIWMRPHDLALGSRGLVDGLGHVERLREPAVPSGEDQPVASGDERAVRDGDAPHHSGIVHDVCRDAGRRQEAPSSIFPHS